MATHKHYYRNHGDGWATCDCGASPDWSDDPETIRRELAKINTKKGH